MPRRRSRPLLEDMLAYAREAMQLVENRTGAELMADRMRFLAVCRTVEIVGEAASQVSPDVRAVIVGVAFQDAISMRHRLVHGYDAVDPGILADTVRRDLPALVAALAAVLTGKLPDEASS